VVVVVVVGYYQPSACADAEKLVCNKANPTHTHMCFATYFKRWPPGCHQSEHRLLFLVSSETLGIREGLGWHASFLGPVGSTSSSYY